MIFTTRKDESEILKLTHYSLNLVVIRNYRSKFRKYIGSRQLPQLGTLGYFWVYFGTVLKNINLLK